MAKLSLNKAAKEAGVAKSTILQALNSKRMSAEKNEKGHWEKVMNQFLEWIEKNRDY